ncbi:Calx-beta domain-containing protein [Thalassoroseus pseudoceratinae]|uniref:Calx-beta domain-containing protein n=1 Tax=Thalassoroseus pseudoceratinae TaxID=2713176 RepID=UPI00141DEB7E|nr:Calx-beta domain-containing protein [Thalassoroseus pseudoceratinae]
MLIKHWLETVYSRLAFRGKGTPRPSRKRRPITKRQRGVSSVESLEERVLLAGPQVVTISPNTGGTIENNTTLDEQFRELTIQFSEGQEIDPATLGGIRVVRSGGDGVFASADPTSTDDVIVSPGFIGVGDRDNEVIVRFAENLPDDLYQIVIIGDPASDSPYVGPGGPLANVNGERFQDGSDFARNFELDLGAKVEGVVPQPIIRETLIQVTDPAAVEDGDTLRVTIARQVFEFEFDTNNDGVSNENAVSIPAINDPITLATRIRNAIETTLNNNFVGPEQAVTVSQDPTDRTIVSVVGTAFSADVSVSGEGIELGDGAIVPQLDRINVYFNTNDPLDPVTATVASNYRLVDAITGDTTLPTNVLFYESSNTVSLQFANPIDGELYNLKIGQDFQGGATITPFNETNDDNSSFNTATDLGELLSSAGRVINALIEPQDAFVLLPPEPGGNDEPGHRDVTPQNHLQFNEDGTPLQVPKQIPVINYNFQTVYGFNEGGVQQENTISDLQKQRIREIFDLFSYYAGVQFVETESKGLTIAVGQINVSQFPGGPQVTKIEPRANDQVEYAVVPLTQTNGAINPFSTGLLIMDGNEPFNQDNNEYGGFFFRQAMEGIGQAIGLGSAFELAAIMGEETVGVAGANPIGEPVFPGDHDITHLRRLYPRHATDIDLYQFNVTETGTLNAQTFAQRLVNQNGADNVPDGTPEPSLLNSHLILFDADGNVLASNDDYFSKDSLIEVMLQSGTYYIGVSAAGNDDYDPSVRNSGFGGQSDGEYELRLGFTPQPSDTATILDADGNPTPLDGDADGVAGGEFTFSFRGNDGTNTIYVDVTNTDSGSGSVANPYQSLSDAFAAATPDTIVRVSGNVSDTPYIIGVDNNGNPVAGAQLANLEVPEGVTLMIDAGAIFKLSNANIDVGSESALVSREGAALQVLGTTDDDVIFTSYRDDLFGGDSDGVGPNVRPDDWGGLVFREDSDFDNFQTFNTMNPGQAEAVFLNYVNHATILFGGGLVATGSGSASFDPITLFAYSQDEAIALDSVPTGSEFRGFGPRPTLSFNTIFDNAGNAISANPNNFSDTLGRIGPDIHDNTIQRNTVNGLFVRINQSGNQALDELEVGAQFDDTDIVHVVTQNLIVSGNPGGSVEFNNVTRPRFSGRLTIDPGVVVKLGSSRIEAERGGAQVIAEGTDDNPIIFTSIFDDTYGGSGTFDTNNDNDDVDQDGVADLPTMHADVLEGTSREEFEALESVTGHSRYSTKTPPVLAQADARPGDDILTIVLDFKEVGEATSSDIFNNVVDAIDLSSFGFTPADFDTIAQSVLAAVEFDYFGIPQGTTPVPVGEDLVIDFLIGDIGTAPIGVTEYYYVQIGSGVSGPGFNGPLGVAGGSVVRNATGVGPAFGIQTGDVVATVFTDIVSTIAGVQGDLVATTNAIAGTTSHEIGHTVSLDHINRAGVVTPNGKPPIMGTGAIDLPDSDRIIDREFSLSGQNQEAGNQSQFHIQQLVDALGTHLIDGTGGTPPVIPGVERGTAAPGDWAGIVFNATSSGSFNNIRVSYAGGGAPAEGDFAEFNPLEIHQAEVRVVNSDFRLNADGTGPAGQDVDRNGRGENSSATIFVRGAQPIIMDNDFRDNDGNTISINANALIADTLADTGNVTGFAYSGAEEQALFTSFANNRGPLVRINRITGSDDTDAGIDVTNGMEVRGTEGLAFNDSDIAPSVITTDTVWDDTDIVHVVRDEIRTTNMHTFGSLLLQSSATSSLVVKLLGATAGFTADGEPLDIDDRIGGTVQIVGAPGFPVVMTSLNDDSVSAGFRPDGFPNSDTNGDGSSGAAPSAGDWRSIQFNQYANDRNVDIILEAERGGGVGPDTNAQRTLAEPLGLLASNGTKGSDANNRAGFEIHGIINPDGNDDRDTYSFIAQTGTEVWIDIDRTDSSLDTFIELMNSAGVVIASSDSNTVLNVDRLGNPRPNTIGLPLIKDSRDGGDFYTTNPKDAGMRVVLPGIEGDDNIYYLRVSSRGTPDSGEYTSGQYELQVRLQQEDEHAGSTVRFADIRYSTDGIEVSGLPSNSPLTGEAGESGLDGAETNNSFGTADSLGNLLATNRNTLSVAGVLPNDADVDFYRFTVDYQDIDPTFDGDDFERFAVTFDIDYAEGFAGGDMTLFVFDDTGRLVLMSQDSRNQADVPAPLNGNDSDDLTRGTNSSTDPFLGPVELPQGDYIVAVATDFEDPTDLSRSSRVPQVLTQFTDANSAFPLTRVEPNLAVDRIVEDHIDYDGFFTLPDADEDSTFIGETFEQGASTDQRNDEQELKKIVDTRDAEIELGSSFVPWYLGDVGLFVVEPLGNNTSRVRIVDPFTGHEEVVVGVVNERLEDLTVRMTDGRLISFDSQNGTPTDGNTGGFNQIDTTNIANDDFNQFNDTITNNRTGGNLVTYSGPNDIAPPGSNNNGVGFTWNAISLNENRDLFLRDGGPGSTNDGYFAIGTRNDLIRAGNSPTGLITYNVLYQFNSNGSAVGNSRNPNSQVIGAGTNIEERGILDTSVGATGDMVNGSDLITGMAVVNGIVWAVDESGDLYTISGATSTNAQLNFVTTVLDEAGNPIQFTGLTPGPERTEDGRYEDTLFATDANGRLYAIATGDDFATVDTTEQAGDLLPVFFNAQRSVQLTSSFGTPLSGQEGLVFSNLTENLWHIEGDRGADPGHGLDTTFDRRRLYDPVPTDRYDPRSPETLGGDTGRIGSSSLQFGAGGLGDDYEFAGGAHGSIETNTFDLTGYSALDEPSLYFNYYLETENAQYDPLSSQDELFRDSLRVFIANDSGEWQLLTTNNEYDPVDILRGDELNNSSIFDVQQTFDIEQRDSWRQVKVDLGPYAGQENLRLRIDFSTFGSMGTGLIDTVGEELRAVNGWQIANGDTFTIAGTSPSTVLAAAQNVDNGGWNTNPNPDIQNATTRPHVSIDGAGDGTFDYYSFTVANAGDVGTFDIDDENFATQLFLFNDSGTVIASSAFGADIQDFTFASAGTYYLGVSSFGSTDDAGAIVGNPPQMGDVYTLHLSLDNHPLNPLGQDPIAEVEPNHPEDVTFEFDNDFTVVFPTGSRINDGDEIEVNDVQDAIFEFTQDASSYTGANIPVEYSKTDTAQEVARAFRDAVRATFGSDLVVNAELDQPQRVNLFSVADVIDVTVRNTSQIELEGIGGGQAGFEAASTNTRIRVHSGMNRFDDGAVSDGIGRETPENSDVVTQIKNALVDVYTDANADEFWREQVFKNYREVIRIIKLDVTDAGPLGLTEANGARGRIEDGEAVGNPLPTVNGQYLVGMPGDSFGSVANNKGLENNNFEGVYIDDIIIGFASRGDYVTGTDVYSQAQNTTFTSTAASEIETGLYQLEIRRATEFDIDRRDDAFEIFQQKNSNTNYDSTLDFTIDIKDLQTGSDVTVVAPRGAEIAEGQTFLVSDGVNTFTFEFAQTALAAELSRGDTLNNSSLFTLTNTGDTNIATVDLTLPSGLVFDVNQSNITVSSGGSLTGISTTPDFQGSNGRVLRVSFSNFEPGETVSFGMDVDQNDGDPNNGEETINGSSIVGTQVLFRDVNGDTVLNEAFQPVPDLNGPAGRITGGSSVRAGNVAVPFLVDDRASTIAAAMRDAINRVSNSNPNPQPLDPLNPVLLDVVAGIDDGTDASASSSTSNRVNLFGAVDFFAPNGVNLDLTRGVTGTVNRGIRDDSFASNLDPGPLGAPLFTIPSSINLEYVQFLSDLFSFTNDSPTGEWITSITLDLTEAQLRSNELGLTAPVFDPAATSLSIRGTTSQINLPTPQVQVSPDGSSATVNILDSSPFESGEEFNFGIPFASGLPLGPELIDTIVTFEFEHPITGATRTVEGRFLEGTGSNYAVFVANTDAGTGANIGEKQSPISYIVNTGIGDANLEREQGQLVISQNKITNTANTGISVDAAQRSQSALAPLGVPINFAPQNDQNLVPGVKIVNNVVATFGQSGISLAGDPNSGTVANAAVPFARVINNTLYGGETPTGTGISVTNNASPTILNNIFANLTTGIIVDASSDQANTVTGFNLYSNNGNNASIGGTVFGPTAVVATQDIVADPAQQLFVDPSTNNFYPADGSPAIDSATNSLPDRASITSFADALGIPESTILAPDIDRFGQTRVDDPQQNPPFSGGTEEIIKDRGAVERADFNGPTVELVDPVDNGNDPEDEDPANTIVRLDNPAQREFVIKFNDLGIGIDDDSVTPDKFTIMYDDGTGPRTLELTNDYLFFYNSNTNEVTLAPVAGLYPFGTYTIVVDNAVNGQGVATGVRDEAGNPVIGNQGDGSVQFTIQLIAGGLSISDAPMITEGDFGESFANFTVTLTSPSASTVSVDYEAMVDPDGMNPATVDEDFRAITGTVTFNPGETTQTITIPIIGDSMIETDETFVVMLSNPVNSRFETPDDQVALGTIIDDDPKFSFPVGVTDPMAPENSGEIVFQVALLDDPKASVAVDFATQDVTGSDAATAGADYFATNGTLVLKYNIDDNTYRVFIHSGGSTEELDPIDASDVANLVVPISVELLDDSLVEVPERFNLLLSNARRVTTDGNGQITGTVAGTIGVADGEATGTITDNEPTVSLFSATVTEGEEGEDRFLDFRVEVEGEVVTPFQLNFDTVDGTAIGFPAMDADYQLQDTSITVTDAGTYTVRVKVFGDDIAEGPSETFSLVLSLQDPGSANLVGGLNNQLVVSGTIIDDDTPSFTISDVTVIEGDDPDTPATAVFTVTLLNRPETGDYYIDYETVAGTATEADYTPIMGRLEFLEGVGPDSQTVSVTITNDDIREGDEEFTVLLTLPDVDDPNIPTPPPVPAIVLKEEGTGTILDDDSPKFMVDDVTVVEGQVNFAEFLVTMTELPLAGETATVRFQTRDGSATAGLDYQATSGTLSFTDADANGQIVRVPIRIDDVDELFEDFELVLSDATNSGILDGIGVGTILDRTTTLEELLQIPNQSMLTTEDIREITLPRTDATGEVIVYTAVSNNDQVTVTVEDNHIILDPVDGFIGTADITVTATTANETATDTFRLTVLSRPEAIITDQPVDRLAINGFPEVVEGDFDGGDGGEDLFFYNPLTGANRFLMNGVADITYLTNAIDPTALNGNDFTQLVAGDFGGTGGFTDLFFYNPLTGKNRMATFQAAGVLQVETNIVDPTAINGNDFTDVSSGSFRVSAANDGDDLFFWNRTTGKNRIVAFNSTSPIPTQASVQTNFVNPAAINGNDFDTVVTGNFDGEGLDDLYFWNGTTGKNRHITLVQSGGPGTAVIEDVILTNVIEASALNGNDFTELTVADYDGDGDDDLFFWNPQTGRNRTAFVDNTDGLSYGLETNGVPSGAVNGGAFQIVIGLNFNGGVEDELFFFDPIGGFNRLASRSV